MPLYKFENSMIEPLPLTAYSNEGLKERQDLQASLRDQIDVVAPATMLLAEEFGSWEDSRRRIDLLALDKLGNLVVIELKRTTDGGFMDLQSIRYSAMVSNMTFDQAVEAHAAYLKSRGVDDDAKTRILDFLEWDDPDENDFGKDVRIVLASAEFSKELTTSVLWLLEHDIDIRCVRLRPYKLDNTILINAEQIIPLPEAEEYQVKLREKGRVERKQRSHSTRDLTKYDVTIDGDLLLRLPKRRAILAVVRALVARGVGIEEISQLVSWKGTSIWRSVEGELDSEEFTEMALNDAEASGASFEPARWFIGDGELIHEAGKTYALTKMWGIKTEDAMRVLIDAYPDKGVSFTVNEHAG